ncbi:MAG: hypothetical protein RL120_18125 [Gammaproteobacteria bacterium]
MPEIEIDRELLWHAAILCVAYFTVLFPASAIIRSVLQPWIDEVKHADTPPSLVKAGAMIGYLERVLMLTFILLDQYTAVGFVLALKAAYRFKDTGNHPQAEYMLVGTFLSLAITLAVGIVLKFIFALG